MKNACLLFFGLLVTSSAFAEFHPVKAKFCDQKPVALENGERVFIDVSQGMIGVGTTEQNCKVVDFKSVEFAEQTPDYTLLLVVSSVGRRSTCAGSDVLPYAGVEFASAVVRQDSLELKYAVGPCENILFKF